MKPIPEPTNPYELWCGGCKRKKTKFAPPTNPLS
jgi:hypothetical protein